MQQKYKTPVIFIGHGSPLNAIEENIYTKKWREIGRSLEKPKAIIMFSAHWITEGYTAISMAKKPEMIYDMYGFPSELYRVKYLAQGNPELTERIVSLFARNESVTVMTDAAIQAPENQSAGSFHPSRGREQGKIILDQTRGLDHGVWSTLIHMFPLADIPVVTVSLDYHMSPRDLLKLGETLLSLREEGVLIMGSGNIVHNLREIDWSGKEKYPWAIEFDARIAEGLEGGRGSKEWEKILDFKTWDIAIQAHPSWDHLLPLFPLMGASGEDDEISFFNEEIEMGSLSMRGVIWKEEK